MANKPSIWLTMQIDEPLKKKAVNQAKKEHVSLSHWIRSLMRKALESNNGK